MQWHFRQMSQPDTIANLVDPHKDIILFQHKCIHIWPVTAVWYIEGHHKCNNKIKGDSKLRAFQGKGSVGDRQIGNMK